jgi:hypothetical protein
VSNPVAVAWAAALFLCLAAWTAFAAEPKPWEKLTDPSDPESFLRTLSPQDERAGRPGCQSVANTENDGDSFRVRSGDKEFLARLYFVDAPETNLRYPDRTLRHEEWCAVDRERSGCCRPYRVSTE